MTIFYHLLEGVDGAENWAITLFSFHDSASLSGVHFTWGLAVAELYGPGTGGNPGIRGLLPPDNKAVNYTTYQLALDSSKKIDRARTDLGTVGTSAGTPLPSGIAPRIHLITQGILSPSNGRMYLPSITANNYAARKITAAAIAIINTALVAALQKMYAPSLLPVIYNRKTLGFNEITDIATSDTPGHLRSRQDPRKALYTSAHVFP